jgi:hypothetical protein
MVLQVQVTVQIIPRLLMILVPQVDVIVEVEATAEAEVGTDGSKHCKSH